MRDIKWIAVDFQYWSSMADLRCFWRIQWPNLILSRVHNTIYWVQQELPTGNSNHHNHTFKWWSSVESCSIIHCWRMQTAGNHICVSCVNKIALFIYTNSLYTTRPILHKKKFSWLSESGHYTLMHSNIIARWRCTALLSTVTTLTSVLSATYLHFYNEPIRI